MKYAVKRYLFVLSVIILSLFLSSCTYMKTSKVGCPVLNEATAEKEVTTEDQSDQPLGQEKLVNRQKDFELCRSNNCMNKKLGLPLWGKELESKIAIDAEQELFQEVTLESIVEKLDEEMIDMYQIYGQATRNFWKDNQNQDYMDDEQEQEEEGLEYAAIEPSSLVSLDDRKLIQEMKEIEKGVEEALEEEIVEEQKVVYDMPIEFNEKVMAYIKIFQGVRRKGFVRGLESSGQYEEMMKGILTDAGLPADIFYLGLIESGYNPKAYSRAHASGPWQFISSTGKRYDLERNWWIDERRDPEKSTIAAARYLKDLYDMFQSWPLALASYNAGEGRVKRAVKKHKTNDFWSLNLPNQTENYVPAFMAATIIAREPEKYGFSIDYKDAIKYDKVKVDECTDLKIIAQCCQVPLEEIKKLNPELRRWCTPPQFTECEVKIPLGTKLSFLENYAKIPKGEKVSWRRHKIRQGETLSQIARRYRTSINAIMDVNSLKSSRWIRAGQYLLIPVPKGYTLAEADLETNMENTRDVKPKKVRWDEANTKKISYIVKKGDTLWDIAQNFGVTLYDIRQWNNLGRKYIYPGNELTLLIPRESETKVEKTKYSKARRKRNENEITYVVKKGDSLWLIAQLFDTDANKIRQWNRLKKNELIYPGDKLTIKVSQNLL